MNGHEKAEGSPETGQKTSPEPKNLLTRKSKKASQAKRRARKKVEPEQSKRKPKRLVECSAADVDFLWRRS